MSDILPEPAPQETPSPAPPTVLGSAPRSGASAGRLGVVVVSAALSLCLTLAALYVYDQKFAQKLVVIDMNAFLNEQRSLLLAGKGDDSDRRFDELEAKLNGLPANQVVLLKSVAVRNATEIKP